MTDAERQKVIGHAQDHVAYGWAMTGLPVRHDRRPWTEEEHALYEETYRRLINERRQSCSQPR